MAGFLLLEAFLLVSALSLDAFVVALSYGADRIKIPLNSAMIITLIGSLTLAASLYLGSALAGVIPPLASAIVCCSILCMLGLYKMIESFKKPKKTFYTLAAPVKILPAGQALGLSAALSLDSLTAGFGAGLTQASFAFAVCLSLGIGLALLYAGGFAGRALAKKSQINLSWLSGVIFVLLGVFKFF
jgi:putative Mn2+ efflux pump MntP